MNKLDEKTIKSIKNFALISMAEGTSFLVLLLIAMPLKYMANMPLMVKYLGWVHGVLFILYIVNVALLGGKLKWSIKRMLLYFLAAILPVAPFIVERKVKREYLSGKP